MRHRTPSNAIGGCIRVPAFERRSRAIPGSIPMVQKDAPTPCRLQSSRMGSNGRSPSRNIILRVFEISVKRREIMERFFTSVSLHLFLSLLRRYKYSIKSSFRVRSDLGEISKFVSGIIGGKSAATAQRVNARCYKTSISSGYSSHSPLLSVGSCSYYASTSTRDLSYGGLAVIHESETACVPQPIWPFVACHQAENIDYEGQKAVILLSLKFQKQHGSIFFFQQVSTPVVYVVARVAICRRRHRRRHHRWDLQRAKCCSNYLELSLLW